MLRKSSVSLPKEARVLESHKQLSSKLKVILHADIAGSTALLQQHEAVAHELIQNCFQRFGEVITSYQGCVHELRGDALLAHFERASDAVAAALVFQEIQDQHIAQSEDGFAPQLRIGIALGEVIIADHTVTGVGVVLAQRVEQLAIPGGLCITTAIHEATPKRLPFDFENMGDLNLKGFEESIRIYRVTMQPGNVVPPPDRSNETRHFTGVSRASIGVVITALLLGSGAAIDQISTDAPAMHWLTPAAEANQFNPITPSIKSITLGARVFQQNCVSCHGARADGNGTNAPNLKTKPADLRVMAITHTDGDFSYKIRKGRGDMPGWEKILTNNDIWNLVNYIQTLDKQPTLSDQKHEKRNHPREHRHES